MSLAFHIILLKKSATYGKKGTILFGAISGMQIDWNDGINKDRMSRPLWQQIKQWLWEKHKIRISVSDGVDKHKYTGFAFTYNGNIIAQKFFNDSPITAEINGIKKAIQYKYKELK